MKPEKLALIAQINEGTRQAIPHNRELGIELVDFRHKTGEVWMRLPYAQHLVGDPDTGLLHGGAITSLVDAACGLAVMIRLGMNAPIATLDLRIDYLKPAPAGRDVVAHACCYKITRHIAFVRAMAHAGDVDDPIAAVLATFIRKDAS